MAYPQEAYPQEGYLKPGQYDHALIADSKKSNVMLQRRIRSLVQSARKWIENVG
jgi:hypothetical protein